MTGIKQFIYHAHDWYIQDNFSSSITLPDPLSLNNPTQQQPNRSLHGLSTMPINQSGIIDSGPVIVSSLRLYGDSVPGLHTARAFEHT